MGMFTKDWTHFSQEGRFRKSRRAAWSMYEQENQSGCDLAVK